jgi:hypothetical protein
LYPGYESAQGALSGPRHSLSGRGVYHKEERERWLRKLPEVGARHRAQWLYQELDALVELRDTAREAMVAESRRHPAHRLLQSIAGLGPVRTAQVIAAVDSPHRFRTKRQLWAYSGLAVTTKSNANYRVVKGELRRAARARAARGLNPNYNRTLKHVFKDAALVASVRGALKPYHDQLVERGMRPALARLTVARKIAAIPLAVWKKGECFDPELVISHAAWGHRHHQAKSSDSPRSAWEQPECPRFEGEYRLKK